MNAEALVQRIARAPLPPAAHRPLRWVYHLVRRRRTVPPAPPAPPAAAIDVRAALATGDAAQVEQAVRDYVQFRLDVEEALSPANRPPPELPLELATGAQSKQFMIDLLPHIQRHLSATPRGRVVDALDVGPGSGHGTALLSSLYASSHLGYRMRVTAVDIVDTYHHYVAAVAPYARHVLRDVFTMTQTFDIVIASHVIEHVADPVGFCQRLQQLARECVFIAAPYNEPRDRLTKGHRNVIDQDLVSQLAAEEVTVMHSVAWGAFCDPPYEMVIAKLPGRAAGADHG